MYYFLLSVAPVGNSEGESDYQESGYQLCFYECHEPELVLAQEVCCHSFNMVVAILYLADVVRRFNLQLRSFLLFLPDQQLEEEEGRG